MNWMRGLCFLCSQCCRAAVNAGCIIPQKWIIRDSIANPKSTPAASESDLDCAVFLWRCWLMTADPIPWSALRCASGVDKLLLRCCIGGAVWGRCYEKQGGKKPEHAQAKSALQRFSKWTHISDRRRWLVAIKFDRKEEYKGQECAVCDCTDELHVSILYFVCK